MPLAINATGTLFKKGDGATPTEVFTTVPKITDVQSPNVKTDLQDVTSHDSSGGFREFLPGLADGESVTAPMWWIPSNTTHVAIRTAAYAFAIGNWKAVFPDSTLNTVSFTGYVTNFQGLAKVGTPLNATLTVKVTALPVWS
jgi:predicted secreted protein